MKYEIELIDGLYCVFVNSRIYIACETLKEAKEAVNRIKRNRIE